MMYDYEATYTLSERGEMVFGRNISEESIEWLLTHLNETGVGGEKPSFFDTYFSPKRWKVEGCVAAIAAICNLVGLLKTRQAANKKRILASANSSPYLLLFTNLMVTNTLSCVLSWTSNNSLVFAEWLMGSLQHANIDVCFLMGGVASTAFLSWLPGLVSALIMLGFAAAQYFAVCRPLHLRLIVTRRRTLLYISFAWLLMGGAALILVSYLLTSVWRSACSLSQLAAVHTWVNAGANVSISLVSSIYFILILICFRIYSEIRILKKRALRSSSGQGDCRKRDEFVKFLLLIVTYAAFIVPYAAVYFYSSYATSSLESSVNNTGLIYYMTLLPYLKFISDPLIYGMRVSTVRAVITRTARKMLAKTPSDSGSRDSGSRTNDQLINTLPVPTTEDPVRYQVIARCTTV